MKTLYVLRHAKSSWGHPEASDFERELSPRGVEAAPCMAQVLALLHPAPELLLTSPARRALQTAELVRGHLSAPLAQQEEAELYLASEETHLRHLKQTSSLVQGLVLIAHNPGLEDLIETLCFGRPYGQVALKTAGLAVLDLDVTEWSQVGPGTATLRALLPSRLMQALLA